MDLEPITPDSSESRVCKAATEGVPGQGGGGASSARQLPAHQTPVFLPLSSPGGTPVSTCAIEGTVGAYRNVFPGKRLASQTCCPFASSKLPSKCNYPFALLLAPS